MLACCTPAKVIAKVAKVLKPKSASGHCLNSHLVRVKSLGKRAAQACLCMLVVAQAYLLGSNC